MNYKNIINMYKPQAKLTIPYRGEGLINLANYYTYKYNNSCDEPKYHRHITFNRSDRLATGV